ncbi:hypothetical protein JT358_08520 [Micrococcales bacterium 31B]|nr:hypothetical protein [Micrococcales bacterium 31B]
MTDDSERIPAHLEAEVRDWHMSHAGAWAAALGRFKGELADEFFARLSEQSQRRVWIDKTRVKTANSTWNKLLLKLAQHPEFAAPTNAEDLSAIVQDICALRVLAYSLENQRRAEKIILNFAAQHNLRVAGIDDYVTHPKPSGYRAVHVTLVQQLDAAFLASQREQRLRHILERGGDNGAALRQVEAESIEPHELHLEIQIHTLLQHAWCEITHDEGYKSATDWPSLSHDTSSRMAALLHEADQLARGLYADSPTEPHVVHRGTPLDLFTEGLYAPEGGLDPS